MPYPATSCLISFSNWQQCHSLAHPFLNCVVLQDNRYSCLGGCRLDNFDVLVKPTKTEDTDVNLKN